MNTQELVKQCIKGKKEAQYQLYQLYAAQMLGVCYRYTQCLEDAEDVLQEGFIKVFRNLAQYKSEGELGAWIRKIMVNTAISYIKKHNRYKKDLQADEIYLHPVSDENPEMKLEIKDLIETIRQLPDPYKVIFNLIAIEGYQYDELCDLLEMNVNTIISQYSRARAQLIQLLKRNDSITGDNYEGTAGKKY